MDIILVLCTNMFTSTRERICFKWSASLLVHERNFSQKPQEHATGIPSIVKIGERRRRSESRLDHAKKSSAPTLTVLQFPGNTVPIREEGKKHGLRLT